MFLTQEKILKKISQDRLRGDHKRALRRALDGLEKWPDDLDVAMEAIQLCFELSDFKQAVTLLKTTIRKHPKMFSQILDFSRESFKQTFNPLLGSFIIETLMRSRNIDAVRDMFRTSSDDYIAGLIKRSETRSRGLLERGDTGGAGYTDNELILGLLYISSGESAKAVGPLGRALANSPGDAQTIGSVLLELERERPGDPTLKFYLGMASQILSHPDKAEARFFQAAELENAPLEEILSYVTGLEEHSKNFLMLTGELLIRSSRESEGASRIIDYLALEDGGWDQGAEADSIKALFPGCIDRKDFALKRLSLLPPVNLHHDEIISLYCKTAAGAGRVKEAVGELEKIFETEAVRAPSIIALIESDPEIMQTAPAQKLLTNLFLSEGDLEKAAAAARLAAEFDPSQIPSLLESVKRKIEKEPENEAGLLAIQAELHAKCGNSESAESILRRLIGKNELGEEELFNLTTVIMETCGVNLEGVVSTIGFSLEKERVSDALPYMLEFYKRNPDNHGEFAASIEDLADGNGELWSGIAELMDLLSKEEQLSPPFRLLQARAHLNRGEVERAVFEFDQLMIFDTSLRLDLIPVYEKAAEKHGDNTTLHLALYQLHLEENQLARASHYLCRALESDPGQIRDVMKNFDKLVEKDPSNGAIWEEMLKAALAMKHLNLAREVLKRAVSILPPTQAASLHIYGARISSADGKWQDGLRCLAVALTSDEANLKAVEEELNIIMEANPRNAEARYIAGETKLRLGREDEAVAMMEKCLELSPAYLGKVRDRLQRLLPLSIKPWLISRILGEIAWTEKIYDKACTLLESAQEGPPESLAGLGSTLERLEKSSSGDIRLELILARNLSLEGKHAESVALASDILERDESAVERVVRILVEMLDYNPGQYEANRFLAEIYEKSGETEKALEPILRLVSLEDIDPNELVNTVSEFFDTHDGDSRFLVPYGVLKARAGQHEDGLVHLRRALESDGDCWEEMLAAMKNVEWPGESLHAASLLKADCYLEGDWPHEAFECLLENRGCTGPLRGETVERIYRIIEKKPEAGSIMLGASLLAGSQKADEAEQLVRRGCSALGEEASIDLRIELAEIFEKESLHERAAGLFREVVDSSSDRGSILRRIEKSYMNWAEREISAGIKDIAGLEERAIEGLISTAADLGRFDDALRLATGGRIEEDARKALTARIYMSTDRPALALSIILSIRNREALPSATSRELSYIEGKACEILGDYGRAAAAFAAAGDGDGGPDSLARARANYTKFLESQLENDVQLLEKTGNLDPE